MDCLFCKILEGEIPSKKVYEDDRIYAFQDIHPQAPIHILVIPKKHINSILDLTDEDADLVGYMMSKISDIVKENDIPQDSIRIVSNCGKRAGQTVFHLHFHILAGRDFEWPPG
ncbi:MAG: histidine triad nucleotide-binding protein [Candidatus Eremiobacteraeota bacterium]|nr:histidine triad nucleotide-binding protein [Candidatus Eremiobacteraeota bacterium]